MEILENVNPNPVAFSFFPLASSVFPFPLPPILLSNFSWLYRLLYWAPACTTIVAPQQCGYLATSNTYTPCGSWSSSNLFESYLRVTTSKDCLKNKSNKFKPRTSSNGPCSFQYVIVPSMYELLTSGIKHVGVSGSNHGPCAIHKYWGGVGCTYVAFIHESWSPRHRALHVIHESQSPRRRALHCMLVFSIYPIICE